MTTIEGFTPLCKAGTFFKAKASDDFIDQILDATERFTEQQTAFPVVIAVRTGQDVFVKFRRPEEEVEATQSTVLALAFAYDADEIAICFSSNVYQGLKAGVVTRTRETPARLIFFELTNEKIRWRIGDPVAQIAAHEVPDYLGKDAIDSFNNPEERARMSEAQASLRKWQPDIDWSFPRPNGRSGHTTQTH